MKIFNKLILACCITFPLILKGQSQYVSPLFTYSIGLNSMYYITYDDLTEKYEDNTTVTSYKINSTKLSLGQGQSYGATYGRIIKDNFSFELGISYFNGNKKEVKSTSVLQFMTNTNYNYNIKIYYSNIFNYSSFNFFPSLIFSANKSNWNPYFRLGAYVSYGNFKETQIAKIYNALPTYFPMETYEYTYIYSPNFIVGWQEGAGIEFSKDKFLNVFLEAQYLTLNYNPDKKVCKEALYQGKDNMSKLTSGEISIAFVDTYDANEQSASNYNEAQKPKIKFSMNNVSLLCGVKINIK